jgi:hypothetical protein
MIVTKEVEKEVEEEEEEAVVERVQDAQLERRSERRERSGAIQVVAGVYNLAHPEMADAQLRSKLDSIDAVDPGRPYPTEHDVAGRLEQALPLDDTLPVIAKSRSDALLVFPDALMMRYSTRIAEFAIKNRIPAISGWAQFAEAGNLMTYGPVLQESLKRLAYYVDRILKGAKPADLPVELPRKFEFVINLKTAKQIGLEIPKSVLYRADRVIR